MSTLAVERQVVAVVSDEPVTPAEVSAVKQSGFCDNKLRPL
jgi:hypothetical protein